MKKEAEGATPNGNVTSPSFIDSSPLGEDLFEGQSQEQIAESLSQLIKTNRIENRLIGLDGAWGSGKSNLIIIIQSKLKETHHVFFYDAWGHQEDLQRRAFLEELTENLCENKIIDFKTWNQKLKDLLARKKETLTKTIPRLSLGVIVTVLVAFFTSILSNISELFDNQNLKIIITLIPLIIGLVIFLIASIRVGHLLSLHDVYSLYSEDELIKKTHATISEQEPSVREFQSWMGDLSKALKAKKLIIVFDNMDRLPPEKLRELWSSIHTFFAGGMFEDIWVIIPFDRMHITEAFENKEDVADQFLSKSFSVIYRVAPPVLTDWQKFFELKYSEAFGNREEAELHTIRRTFDLFQDQITPRNIIAFINEIVSLRLVVEKAILLRYIAVFALAKKEILKAPVDQILNLEFLQKAAPLFKEDEDLPNHIAALVYHVPLASASQVSLTREIQISLNDKNGTRFNKLAIHPHFVDILEQVIAGDDLDVDNSAATLAMLEDKFTKSEDVAERVTNIWDSLCGKIGTPISKQTFTITHEMLLRNSSPTVRLALARGIVDGVRNAENFSGADYYNAIYRLNSYISENNLDIDVISLVADVKKSPEVFVDYVKAAGGEYKTFKLKCDETELQEYIVERVPAELEGLAALSAVQQDYEFNPVIDRLEQEIPENSLTSENIEPFYKFYKAITTKKPILTLKDEHINTLLSEAKEGSEAQYELLAMRLARLSEYSTNSGIAQTILGETDEKKVTNIAKRIEYYTTFGELLLGFVSWEQPLLKNVLRDLILNNYGTSSMSITSVLEYFKSLYTSLEITPEDFIKRLEAWKKYAKDEITAENVANIIPDYEFFEYAIEIKSEFSDYLISAMVEHLNSLTVENWLEPLRDVDSYLFHVTYWLLRGGQLKAPPDNAVTVYKDILTDTAKGEFTMKEEEKWGLFYEKINKSKLKATAKNIRDIYLTEVTIDTAKFQEFSEILIELADLMDKSGDVARKILATVVDDEDCLAIILNHDGYFSSLVKDAGDDASDFKDKIRQNIETPGADKKLIEFAIAIGIADVDEAKHEKPEQKEGQEE